MSDRKNTTPPRMLTVALTLSEDHYRAMIQACEDYFRIALGQFNVVAKEHVSRVGAETGQSWYDIERAVDMAVKGILMPGFHVNASYGVGNRNVSKMAHCCYELWKAMDRPNAFTLNYTGLPLPVAKVEGHK